MRRLPGIRATGFAALLVATFVLSAPASSAQRAKARGPCAHGVSSIGPVSVRDGKVIGGDAVPFTERCLP